ncbi:STAS domain-containing protein [Streptomyces sp. NBC_00320]|uniref:STAS domain-containing protein n=1 Tax=unclassified Streptomyces TaxID=2593676 RepID=UPI0022589053|nr:STAS domain-containing protein [Streptomyces sp. NBC_00320]MCX5150766.1 STAS domain-containing protein [Streptomyces sp. NBC_00320]
MTTTLIDLKAAVRNDGDLRVTRELDFHTAGQVEPRLTDLAASGHRSLVLDLSGISFCDSAGHRPLPARAPPLPLGRNPAPAD